MPWVRLDDQFYLRPRVRSAGLEGRALFVAGLCYCSQNLTDGHLPAPAIPLVAAMAEVEPSVADHLVTVGLWDSVPDGYTVIDFLSFNPSRASVLADREAAAERQRRSRQSRGMSRRDSRSDNGTRHAVSSAAPVPVPIDSSNSTRPQVTHEDDELSTSSCVPAETWDHYAQLKLDQQTTTIRNPGPWKAKCRRNAMTELADQAQRWWTMFELTPQRLAACLIDGKAPRNANRRPTQEPA